MMLKLERSKCFPDDPMFKTSIHIPGISSWDWACNFTNTGVTSFIFKASHKNCLVDIPTSAVTSLRICDLSRWCFFSLITQLSFTYQTLILLMVASPRATHSQYFECNVALFSTKIHGPSKWNMNPIMNDELNIHHFASGSKRFWVYMY